MVFLGRIAADLAIDLGTSYTRVVGRGKGIVVEEPTVVATNAGPRGFEVVAVGAEAKEMLGRTPTGIQVVRPVRGGVVADFDATERLLRYLLKNAGGRGLLKPRILVCIPSGTTEVERRAVQESARAAGGREVYLANTSLTAAIGAQLPIHEAVGSMIIDIGGGRTEVAVISLGGLVVGRSVRIGGDAFDEAISHWLRQKHSLLIGERTAEAIKLEIGWAGAGAPEQIMRIRGRDLGAGVPREVEISATEISQAVAEPLARVRQLVLDALQETPPELASDIVDRGVILTGGGSLPRGLDRALRDATGLPVLAAEKPTHCVALGAGRLLEDSLLFGRIAAAS